MSGLKYAVEAAEVAQLTARWGVAPQEHHRLEVDDPFLTGEHQLLVSNGRRAEICYVMHRGDPQAGVLLHIKTFYPMGAYRLPTGGIHQGEAVFDTLIREIDEETGLAVGVGADQVQVQRFLGIVACEFDHHTLGRTFPFATYAFLVQMPADATLQPRDPEESIGGWQWRRPADLPAVADFLQDVGTHAPDWGDWGRYRALIHRFVGQRLAIHN
jgi:8-oxo-dGTP pyrophosphatase MutT (NUDIX family)